MTSHRLTVVKLEVISKIKHYRKVRSRGRLGLESRLGIGLGLGIGIGLSFVFGILHETSVKETDKHR